jgi:two-component system response regulator YesN
VSINVVIVDDEADIRDLLRIVIEGSGKPIHVCGEARDGVDALNVIEATQPDIVVMDERMPRMTGCETAAEILKRRPLACIILCSAYVDTDLERRAKAAGVRLCIPKGDIARIPEAIMQLIARAVPRTVR